MTMQNTYLCQHEEPATLFDDFGRCIPMVKNSSAHFKTRRYFQFEEQEIDYQSIYQRLNTAFDIKKQLSFNQFQSQVESLIQDIQKNDSLKSVLNGPTIPFIVPQTQVIDIGEELNNTYIKAVKNTFTSTFPDYEFNNYCSEIAKGSLSVAAGSRHDKLLTQITKQAVVGLYFPCFMEYSVPAMIEQIKFLPEQCLLAGGFDACAALVAAPNLLQRKKGYPPLLWLAGLEDENTKAGYHFEAYGYNLTFNRRSHFDHVAEYWSSGMVILAS